MIRRRSIWLPGALVLLATALSARAGDEARIRLPDGRILRGTALREERSAVVLETPFGELRVARPRLRPPAEPAGATRPAVPTAPDVHRETSSTWWRIESDLADERVASYHAQLDAFVTWMIGVYGLDRKRLERSAPFCMRVFRARDDFKHLQDQIAPGIAAAKGRGFAEGVAGFYDPGSGTVYLWDAEGSRGESHPTTALHETAHLLNHRLAQATGIRFPVWFEEGTAVYFQTWTPGVREPEPHLAALVSVVGWIEDGEAPTHRDLRGIPYASFHSDEYAWGWSLVHFLRRHDEGKLWAPLLEHLRTIGDGAPTDSENRRFLKALGYRDDERFDHDWHAHVLALKPKGEGPLGTSAASLGAIDALELPTAEQAALFARLGASFAASGLPGPAVTYLAAALRGGVDGVELRLLLAEALAAEQGLDRDEAWPPAVFEQLERAVELDPLSAPARLALGRQRLLRARTPEEAAGARDTLGLGLVVLRPVDDAKTLARWALRATLEASPGLTPQEALDQLVAAVPAAAPALRSAWIHFLQTCEAWDLLLETLGAREAAGTATFEERATLAGLYRASDQNDRAARLYRSLLGERPDAWFLWPHLVHALVADRRLEEARAARDEALQALAAAPPSLAPLRRAVERIRIR